MARITILNLPTDIHYLWMNHLTLVQLFKLRQVNCQVRDVIDNYLRLYFRSGPEMVAWYSLYNTDRILSYSFQLSLKKKSHSLGIQYSCKHYSTKDDFYDQLYSVFPMQSPSNAIVDLNVLRVWITLKLLRIFPNNRPFGVFQPHKLWGDDSECPNVECGNGNDCPGECFCFGGIQLEFLQDLKLSNKECSSSDSRFLLDYDIYPVDIGAQIQSVYPGIFPKIQVNRGSGAPEVPYDLEIYGANFRIQDFKRILPQNPDLLKWYDRIVIGQ